MVMTMDVICDFDGCGKTRTDLKFVRGYCINHYNQLRTSGELPAVVDQYATAEESLRERSARRGECLIWTGTKNQKGYGRLANRGRVESAHRVAYELSIGPIPAGMEIDHICFIRACIEPEHLRLSDRAANTQYRRGAQPNSKSGIRNVHEKNGKWYVRLKVKQENRWWGPFETVDEAKAEAKRRREEFFYRSAA